MTLVFSTSVLMNGRFTCIGNYLITSYKLLLCINISLFLCGKSLLELARMENSVLGNALEGVPEELEEEEQPSNSEHSALCTRVR